MTPPNRSRLIRHSMGLLLLACAGLTAAGCNGLTAQRRLMAAYSAGGDLVTRQTGATVYATSTGQPSDRLVGFPNLNKRVSAAQFNRFIWVAWVVEAYDALGGAPLFKIRVSGIPGTASSQITIQDGGRNTEPALVVHQGRLFRLLHQD